MKQKIIVIWYGLKDNVARRKRAGATPALSISAISTNNNQDNRRNNDANSVQFKDANNA